MDGKINKKNKIIKICFFALHTYMNFSMIYIREREGIAKNGVFSQIFWYS